MIWPFSRGNSGAPDRPKLGPPPQIERNAAADILSLCGRNPSEHQILQDNLASYLAHLGRVNVHLPVAQCRSLKQLDHCIQDAMWQADTGKDRSVVLTQLRWLSKMDRDISQPYSDQNVGQHLRRCSTELNALLPKFQSIPHQLWLVGGPLASNEGRFGGNSDLDVVMVVSDEDRPKADLVAQGWDSSPRRSGHDLVQLYITSSSQQPQVMDYFGEGLPLQSQNIEQQVGRAVRDGLESHGLIAGENGSVSRKEWPDLHTDCPFQRFPLSLVTVVKV